MVNFLPQLSSSSDSLDGHDVDYAKSYDAVVFDVLKVTPEEFAVSTVKHSISQIEKCFAICENLSQYASIRRIIYIRASRDTST